jgi:tetratricopeptide (TPR) repeat protein
MSRRALAFTVALALLSVMSRAPAQENAAGTSAEALKLFIGGRYEEARRHCLEELRGDPQSIEAYVVLAWSLIALERYADAENYALKGYALRRDPRLTESLGEAAYYLGRNEAALRNFQNYVSAVPEGTRVGQAYYFMGEIYVRLARFSHADIAFTAALGYTPLNAHWWMRLGWAREKANDPTHAIEAYKQALVIDPRLADAKAGLARVSERLR